MSLNGGYPLEAATTQPFRAAVPRKTRGCLAMKATLGTTVTVTVDVAAIFRWIAVFVYLLT
jgi:hypothetical protein